MLWVYRCLAYLRWDLTLRPGVPQRLQRDVTPFNIPKSLQNILRLSVTAKGAGRQQNAFGGNSGIKPGLSLPPNPSCDEALERERGRLSSRFRGGTFQISASWQVSTPRTI